MEGRALLTRQPQPPPPPSLQEVATLSLLPLSLEPQRLVQQSQRPLRLMGRVLSMRQPLLLLQL